MEGLFFPCFFILYDREGHLPQRRIVLRETFVVQIKQIIQRVLQIISGWELNTEIGSSQQELQHFQILATADWWNIVPLFKDYYH